MRRNSLHALAPVGESIHKGVDRRGYEALSCRQSTWASLNAPTRWRRGEKLAYRAHRQPQLVRQVDLAVMMHWAFADRRPGLSKHQAQVRPAELPDHKTLHDRLRELTDNVIVLAGKCHSNARRCYPHVTIDDL